MAVRDSQETRRAYHRQWMRRRRDEWFAANGPCVQCGSWERLELDHVNPAEKEHHAVWSWRKDRREAELAKCQVLCHDCHLAKSNRERASTAPCGTYARYKAGCRCDECRRANAEYAASLRPRYGPYRRRRPDRVCQSCGATYTHEIKTGRPYSRCPSCRARDIPKAWLGGAA